MPEVDPEHIADDLGGLLEGNATLVVPMITTMAKAYTRGRGFTANWPNDEIAAVIASAAARFVSNPAQTSSSDSAGPFTRDVRSYFQGWSLAERYVLDRYRVKAM